MRRLQCYVPTGSGAEVLARAAAAGATDGVRLDGRDADDTPQELLLLYLPNDRFDDVLEVLEDVDDLRLTFQRDSVVALSPPAEELPDQVSDVTSRGPLEMLVEGLQSLGAWPPFLVYSATAGAVVWAGLVSETVFLLTAAMLIAPYAAPAMTTALATARGDGLLLRRSVGRYLAAVATTAVTAALLTLVTGESAPTELMLQVADVSAMSVLLPMAAGVAGALGFSRADRTGIVSGAGIGMLVALALAPQAGLLGIGLALGEARIVGSAAFVATLQLVGINVAASLVFHLLGVRRQVPRVRDGSLVASLGAAAATAVALVGLLVLQWQTAPDLTRETVMTRAEAITLSFLDEQPGIVATDAVARFPLADNLPIEVFALRAQAVALSADAASGDELTAALDERLREEFPSTNPTVVVSVERGS
ncbi:DUF389 domain-containing protein [Egicoccus halophilus]|uniref:TIGR00341 family protein n=1 Tax=Egicoccus halophilus TaxID=1670830 RepID=A0A8J3EST0_9ACTN|nr:DUF389 domain-containing protein [Egicoccus halophilus]GGI08080.1 hypothetical protein GCM10011354_27310 [Egicoccus halophilus]